MKKIIIWMLAVLLCVQFSACKTDVETDVATDSAPIVVITPIPRQENEDPEITVLPHDEALTPEVSNLPQGEEKPDIQKIKEQLFVDYSTSGDIYQSNASLEDLLNAAGYLDSLTLSNGETLWRVPKEDSVEITNQISANSSIVVDFDYDFSYIHLRKDDTIEHLETIFQGLVMCEYIDGLTYDPDDPVYFWRAIHYCIGQNGSLSEDGNWVELSQSEIIQLSKVLFSGNTEIPEIPEIWKEIYQKTEDGVYRFKTGEYGFVETNLEAVSSGGTGIFADVILEKDLNTLGYWHFELDIIGGMLCVTGMSANEVQN